MTGVLAMLHSLPLGALPAVGGGGLPAGVLPALGGGGLPTGGLSVVGIVLCLALLAAHLSAPWRDTRPITPCPPAQRHSPSLALGDSPSPSPSDSPSGAPRAARQSGGDEWAEDCRILRRSDCAVLMTAVATQLDAGLSPRHAWRESLRDAGLTHLDCDDEGIPHVMTVLHERDQQRDTESRPWQWRVLLVPGSEHRRERAARAAAATVAACRLSHALGAPLAAVLHSIALSLSDSDAVHSERLRAFAGPRSTAHLVSALPLVGLIAGSLVGADSWSVLSAHGGLLAWVGLGCMCAGWLWTRQLLARASATNGRLDPAIIHGLVVAGLEAGISIPGVLRALAYATGDDTCAIVSRALLLGSSWQEAWQIPPQAERYSHLRRCLHSAWRDGASAIALLEVSARSIRDQQRSAAQQDVARLTVRLVLPLGLCYLPAFVVLGIVPVVLSVGGSMIGGVL